MKAEFAARPPPPSSGRPRRWLAAAAAATALSAYAGAIGLATGAIDFGAPLNARLPFGSLAFAGLALAVVVGAPFTIVAVMAARGDERAAAAAWFAGGAMIVWIAVEVLVLRSFSFLQPVCAAVGIAFVVVGRRGMSREVLSARCRETTPLRR